MIPSGIQLLVVVLHCPWMQHQRWGLQSLLCQQLLKNNNLFKVMDWLPLLSWDIKWLHTLKIMCLKKKISLLFFFVNYILSFIG